MALFGTDHTDTIVRLAERIGELVSNVGTLEARLLALESRPVAVSADVPQPLPPEIVASITANAMGSSDLYRHLETMARQYLAEGQKSTDIIFALRAGSAKRVTNE